VYNIGEQFIMSYKNAKPNDAMIYRGKKWRITILNERLVRMEYNEKGIFEDRPTQLVRFRNFDRTLIQKREDENFIELTTNYFVLLYAKDKPFDSGKVNSGANLKVLLKDTEKLWYFGNPEARNYLSTNVAFDYDNKMELKKGLYSEDGFALIDDSNGLVLDEYGMCKERENKGIDIYLFCYKNDFNLCLKDYYQLTGAPALIPRYALGNWWCKNYQYNDNDLEKLFGKFQKNEIPMSVFLFDRDWHIRNTENLKNIDTGYTWNTNLLSNPVAFSKKIHSEGYKLGVQIDPTAGILSHESIYQTAIKYLKRNEKGVVPFAPYDPKFLDVFFKLILHPLENMGVDFFWIDYKEKDLNVLWALNNYIYLDSNRTEAKRGMILSRNSMIGAHRYPVLYSGNTKVSWDTLKFLPYYNSSAANMGISWWSHDIGGYYEGTEDSELYLRYVQFGTFSPILRFHVDYGKYYKREPWRWNYETFQIVADYLNLRHKLIPYLYTEAYQYYKNGIPLIRPLYYDTPKIYDEPQYRNEYLFGSQLLIAPITEKNDPVMDRAVLKLFLPEGTWYSFKTGKRFPGNKKYVTFYRDEDYPIFARSGSIIPMTTETNLNNIIAPSELEIHIFPGKSNTYNLYEDDGYSNLYKKGYYIITQIDYNYIKSNYTVIFRPLEGKTGIVPKTRNYKIRFRNTKKADGVEVYVKDKKIPFESYVDENDFVVEIKDAPTLEQVLVNCKGKDIENDSLRLVNEEIDNILYDLPIETKLKEKIASIIFDENLPINKKRIEIKKLKRKKLEKKFINLFIKLLEYISQI